MWLKAALMSVEERGHLAACVWPVYLPACLAESHSWSWTYSHTFHHCRVAVSLWPAPIPSSPPIHFPLHKFHCSSPFWFPNPSFCPVLFLVLQLLMTCLKPTVGITIRQGMEALPSHRPNQLAAAQGKVHATHVHPETLFIYCSGTMEIYPHGIQQLIAESGEKVRQCAAAPPHLICFFLRAGIWSTNMETEIQDLLLNSEEIGLKLLPILVFHCRFKYLSLKYFSFSHFSAPGLSGSGTAGGVPDMGGSIYSKTQVCFSSCLCD